MAAIVAEYDEVISIGAEQERTVDRRGAVVHVHVSPFAALAKSSPFGPIAPPLKLSLLGSGRSFVLTTAPSAVEIAMCWREVPQYETIWSPTASKTLMLLTSELRFAISDGGTTARSVLPDLLNWRKTVA